MGAVFVFRTRRVDASERVIKWRYLMDMKNKENYNNKNKNQKNGKSERKMRTSNAQEKNRAGEDRRREQKQWNDNGHNNLNHKF